MSATYTGPVYVATYALYAADGRLAASMQRRVAAPALNTARAFAKSGIRDGWTLTGVYPATHLDKQSWL